MMEPEKRKVQDASRPLIVSFILALIHLPICSSRRSAFADKPRRQPGKLSLPSSKRRKRSTLPRYVLRGSSTDTIDLPLSSHPVPLLLGRNAPGERRYSRRYATSFAGLLVEA
jgi:hypothetical protein